MKTKLNNLAFAGLAIICILILGNTTINKKNGPTCLTISGKITDKGNKKPEKACVYLIKENSVIDSLHICLNTTFTFPLEKNCEYSIKIFQKGYATRLIYISTRLPKRLKDNQLFEFHFDLIPFKPDSMVNTDMLDFPVALVYYQPLKGCFDYNKKYTSYIKKEFNQPVFN